MLLGYIESSVRVLTSDREHANHQFTAQEHLLTAS